MKRKIEETKDNKENINPNEPNKEIKPDVDYVMTGNVVRYFSPKSSANLRFINKECNSIALNHPNLNDNNNHKFFLNIGEEWIGKNFKSLKTFLDPENKKEPLNFFGDLKKLKKQGLEFFKLMSDHLENSFELVMKEYNINVGYYSSSNGCYALAERLLIQFLDNHQPLSKDPKMHIAYWKILINHTNIMSMNTGWANAWGNEKHNFFHYYTLLGYIAPVLAYLESGMTPNNLNFYLPSESTDNLNHFLNDTFEEENYFLPPENEDDEDDEYALNNPLGTLFLSEGDPRICKEELPEDSLKRLHLTNKLNCFKEADHFLNLIEIADLLLKGSHPFFYLKSVIQYLNKIDLKDLSSLSSVDLTLLVIIGKILLKLDLDNINTADYKKTRVKYSCNEETYEEKEIDIVFSDKALGQFDDIKECFHDYFKEMLGKEVINLEEIGNQLINTGTELLTEKKEKKQTYKNNL